MAQGLFSSRGVSITRGVCSTLGQSLDSCPKQPASCHFMPPLLHSHPPHPVPRAFRWFVSLLSITLFRMHLQAAIQAQREAARRAREAEKQTVNLDSQSQDFAIMDQMMHAEDEAQ